MKRNKITMAVSRNIGKHPSYFVASDDECEHEPHGCQTKNDHGRDPDDKIHRSLTIGLRLPKIVSQCTTSVTGIQFQEGLCDAMVSSRFLFDLAVVEIR